MNIAGQLKDWLPIRVQWQQRNPLFDWCFFGERRFTEPFFDETVQAMFHYPFNLLMRPLTGIDVLADCYKLRPGLPPTGFIYHLSRCGSTLISQMLAAVPRNVIVSEASPLDWMIRAKLRRPEITDEERIEWIHWTVAALGQKRTAEAEHYFIKLDSWHVFDLDVLTRAFPDTPWIFLYRNPLEVMVSHNRQRGGGTIPGIIGHQLPGLTFEDSLQISAEEYVARVLAKICESALEFRDHPNALFVNYNQLPQFVTSTLLRHFRVDYSEDETDIMNSAARFDAKSPAVEFTDDAARKRKEADETTRRLSEKMLMPLYERLEAARSNKSQ
ncbi:MAG: sulfotransferase [Acidobacteriota bacterium]|nr:sulfotransferase [Acidobacteriota bacterium]